MTTDESKCVYLCFNHYVYEDTPRFVAAAATADAARAHLDDLATASRYAVGPWENSDTSRGTERQRSLLFTNASAADWNANSPDRRWLAANPGEEVCAQSIERHELLGG